MAGISARMVLHADEPGMVRDLTTISGRMPSGGMPRTANHLLQPVLVVDVDLIAMAVALADHVLAVDVVHLGATPQIAR